MGARGIELDRTAITFFGFCMLILVVVVICFQVKSNERLEEVGYHSFKECTLFILKKSDQIEHLEYAKQLDQKILNKTINGDVEQIKAECLRIISEISEKKISERVIIYYHDI